VMGGFDVGAAEDVGQARGGGHGGWVAARGGGVKRWLLRMARKWVAFARHSH
jgi:hypothetical protein